MTTSTKNQNNNTATEHDTRTESDYASSTTTATRSKDAHRGITIRGSGPASGRPLTSASAVDLQSNEFMIVSGWSTC
ncbi:hypothetical protein [Pseudonocardia sp. HH130629-09]|uniref:hypothetical protein n=1 Tax=Pseudonocardia sp. HH130629-09 TaxID=1641402 RepID=UPI000B33FF6F|nr:hypothetical protein [Pseudonocardia sp. HH130629-09]